MAKFGKGVNTPMLVVEHGAELEGWRKFLKRFEVALIGAGMEGLDRKSKSKKAKDKEEEERQKFENEQRKAALLLDCMGDVGMEIFETWDIEVAKMQYVPLREAFDRHFATKENIVATRHRFFSQEQKQGETIDKYIERLERAGRTCRFGGLLDELVLQMVIKGMSEDKLRKELLVKRELHLAEARDICNQYESAMAASKIIRGKVDISEVDRVEQEDPEGRIARMGDARSFSYRKAKPREGTCFTCGKPGHFARECRDKEKSGRRNNTNATTTSRKCFNCGVEGHFARECPKQRPGQKSRGRINAVETRYDTSDSSDSL